MKMVFTIAANLGVLALAACATDTINTETSEPKRRERAQLAIAASGNMPFNSPSDVVMGNPNGDVTIVEFFDYNCIYCKRSMRDRKRILASDPDVRFVLKEFPILGKDSDGVHRVSTAVRLVAPEQYEAFNLELLGRRGRTTKERAIVIAVKLSVDEARLREAIDDPAVTESLRQTSLLANSLGITKVPSYVIGNEKVVGSLGFRSMSNKVANLRSCGSTVC